MKDAILRGRLRGVLQVDPVGALVVDPYRVGGELKRGLAGLRSAVGVRVRVERVETPCDQNCVIRTV